MLSSHLLAHSSVLYAMIAYLPYSTCSISVIYDLVIRLLQAHCWLGLSLTMQLWQDKSYVVFPYPGTFQCVVCYSIHAI